MARHYSSEARHNNSQNVPRRALYRFCHQPATSSYVREAIHTQSYNVIQQQQQPQQGNKNVSTSCLPALLARPSVPPADLDIRTGVEDNPLPASATMAPELALPLPVVP